MSIISLNSLNAKSCYHIETSQLICSTNQLTSFNMMATLEFNKLQSFYNINKKVLHFLRFSLNTINHQSEKEKARQVTAANFWNVQKKLTVPNKFFVNFQ